MRVGTLGTPAATSYVIANMIGTGVFTSLGFQLFDLHDGTAILLLWLMGGVIALCGALAYSELGATFPNAGGEYNFLSRILHPSVGFAAGLTSATVGFAAPVALAAMALGKYLTHLFPGTDPTIAALVVIAGITVVHARGVAFGGRFQVVASGLKVVVILAFVAIGLAIAGARGMHLPSGSILADVTNAKFAVAAVYVGYAYSGWNAAAYFVHEVKDPNRTLPRALLLGTGLVTALYVLLNLTFLAAAPASELMGKEEVAAVASDALFGARGGAAMSGVIALLLISTVSSMVFAGPRVLRAIGDDYPALGVLRRETADGVPRIALAFQSGLSMVLVLTASFEMLLTYTGFVLTGFTTLTGIALLVQRHRHGPPPGDTFRVPLYPLPVIIFVLFNVWVVIFVAKEKPMESMIGLGTVLLGAFAARLLKRGNARGAVFLLGVAMVALGIGGCAGTAHADEPKGTTTATATANEAARFIAGLPVSGDSEVAKLTAEPGWKKYAASADSAWSKFVQPKIDTMTQWRNGISAPSLAGARTVFYPFSGPDVLFPLVFFPEATTLYLFALEPVGSFPEPKVILGKSLTTFGEILHKSIRSAAHMGFYITDDMEVRLRNKNVDGTLPIILYYLARMGATVDSVSPVKVTAEGALESGDRAKESGLGRAVAVQFTRNGEKRTVYYFSGDLSDKGLSEAPGMAKFLAGLPKRGVVTQLKSASYLLHHAFFSEMKKVVLEKSKAIVQDDSGVPIKHLLQGGWELALYGRYSHPLPYFKKFDQSDLAATFREKKAAPLPFRYGYGYVCNLAIATAKD